MSMKNSKRGARGFTLLEVLVALTILSIGLLGIAGLMMVSLKNNQSAVYRSQAAWLAYDIVDRMRANRGLALPAAGASPYSYTISSTAVPGAGVAHDDLDAWKTAVTGALTSGGGSVAVVPATGVTTVTIQWDDTRSGVAATGISATQTYTMSTRI
jgi:type IV pilus assembly protein PilV